MIKLNYYLLFIFLTTSCVFCQTKYIRTVTLPCRAKELLNKEFERWDYFNSSIPYFDSTGIDMAWEYADLIKGDFNGDSNNDYAALIKPYNVNNGFLIVLLKNENTYNLIKLKEVPFYKDRVLYLEKKGSELYDYESDDTFVLPFDGLYLGIYEKIGVTYYMEDGKFNAIASSD